MKAKGKARARADGGDERRRRGSDWRRSDGVVTNPAGAQRRVGV